MQRGLEVTKYPELFSQRVKVIITYDGALIDETVSNDDSYVDADADRLLCHAVKHSIGELLKTVRFHPDEKQRNAAAVELRSELRELHTGGDLVALGQFVAHNREHLEALVPPRRHREYRSSRLKVDFIVAAGELAMAALKT